MTEDEAKQKWCPFTRAVSVSDDGIVGLGNRLESTINADLPLPNASKCIASDCMAWRTGKTTVHRPSAKHAGNELVSETIGYCGLAGKP